jgi:hypothetical protein
MITSEEYVAGALGINQYFRSPLATNLIAIWGGGSSGLVPMLTNISERIDSAITGENVLSNDEIEYINDRLGDSWNSTILNFGQPDDWQKNLNSTTEFSFGGNYSSIYFKTNLEKYGGLDPAYDVNYPGIIAPDLQTIWSQRYQAYSQFIDLADPDSAKSILPFGISENPDSIYFNNLADDWVNGTLHPAPLTEAIIETMEDSTTYLTYN